MQIVIAWVEQDAVVVKAGRVDIGEMHTFKTIQKPMACMWANHGTQADLEKAKVYAAREGYLVLCYTGEKNPLNKARQEIIA